MPITASGGGVGMPKNNDKKCNFMQDVDDIWDISDKSKDTLGEENDKL